MPIQAFSFPLPETRFFQVGQHIYKFKIRRGSKISDEKILDSDTVTHEELENAVRVVLMSLDNLHPFITRHFKIFPYKSRWERVSELRFRKGDRKLFAYPFLITLYVETNETIPSHTEISASKLVPSGSTFPPSGVNLCSFEDKTSGLGIPQCSTFCAYPSANEHECRKTKEPQEGPLSSDHHNKEDTHQCLQDLPNLSGGAEEMFRGSEDSEYDDLEESVSSASELHVVKQDSKSTENENPGVLARLARITAFPFSLLFKRRQ